VVGRNSEVDHASAILKHRDITHHADEIATELADSGPRVFESILFKVTPHDTDALVSEPDGSGCTDTASGTGDDHG
jgi:hypothetical protein